MSKIAAFLKRRFAQFDLVPEYFNAMAMLWQDLLFGGSVLAVAFLLWWALAKEANPNVLLTVFVVAMFIAGYYTWRAEHIRLLPKLGLARHVVQLTPTIDQGGQPTGSSVYVQIIPTCLTDSPVYECQAYLLSVKRLGANGEWEETAIDEPLLLNWSIKDNIEPVTLFPRVPQRLNVCFVHSSDLTLRLCSNVSLVRYSGVLNLTDRFRFEIRFTAKDCEPLVVAVKLQIGPVWNEPQSVESVKLV